MRVQDPDGQVRRVGRRWVPWRRRSWRDVNAPDLVALFVPGDLAELVLLLVVILVAVVASLLLVPVIVGIEFLLVLVVNIVAAVLAVQVVRDVTQMVRNSPHGLRVD